MYTYLQVTLSSSHAHSNLGPTNLGHRFSDGLPGTEALLAITRSNSESVGTIGKWLSSRDNEVDRREAGGEARSNGRVAESYQACSL